METVVERPAALDVHKEQVTACVRVPVGRDRREQHLAEFKTTVQGLLALRDWLQAHGATQVAMEASGVYWKPPWAILEDEFECVVCHTRRFAVGETLIHPPYPRRLFVLYGREEPFGQSPKDDTNFLIEYVRALRMSPQFHQTCIHLVAVIYLRQSRRLGNREPLKAVTVANF